MKKLSILSLASLLFLMMSCHPAVEEKISPDRLTFGVKGNVKMVFHSILVVETTDEEMDNAMIAEDEHELSFDREGRVTYDGYDNSYEYDDNGEFVEGISPNTVLTRDSEGRILCYDNTELDFESDDFDIMDFIRVSYTYDDKGRVSTENYVGWEWMTEYTYSYDGDKIYPSSCTFESRDEGWNSDGTITFEYLSFDDKGNWTERLVTRNADNYEEPWDDNEPEIEHYMMKTRETREIQYWDED